MMTLLKHVLVLFFFALPILTSSSRSNRPVKTSSKTKCRDLNPKWCRNMKTKYPGRFAEECGKIGSKVPNFQKEAIEKFCCKTCRVLRVNDAKAHAKVKTSKCEDRRADWCRKLNLKHPETFERLCEPNWITYIS